MPDQDHASLERVRQWLEGGAQPSMTDVGAVLALALALALRQGPVSGEWPERAKDIAWLERQKETGHCGESTSEAIQRGRVNACIDRLLSAIPAGGEGEGWRLVPIEPTREMWAAMADVLVGYRNRYHDKVAGDLWAAVLKAAPAPAKKEAGVGDQIPDWGDNGPVMLPIRRYNGGWCVWECVYRNPKSSVPTPERLLAGPFEVRDEAMNWIEDQSVAALTKPGEPS